MKEMALRWMDFVERKIVVGMVVFEFDMFEIFCV